MEFFESIKAWWSKWIAAHRQKAAAKREAQMEKESCADIQAMEFGGNLYIAHNGVPIVRVDRLNVEATKLLAESRKDYMAWKRKFGGRYV